MNDHLIVWVDYATDQYLALDERVRIELDAHLARLAHDPTSNARYDPGTDRWSSEFDAGQGMVLYIVNPDYRRICDPQARAPRLGSPTAGRRGRRGPAAGADVECDRHDASIEIDPVTDRPPPPVRTPARAPSDSAAPWRRTARADRDAWATHLWDSAG